MATIPRKTETAVDSICMSGAETRAIARPICCEAQNRSTALAHDAFRLETAPGAWRVRGMNVPPGMEFCVTAPGLASRKFSVSGAGGGSRIDQDTLILSPEGVDPERGLTITMSD